MSIEIGSIWLDINDRIHKYVVVGIEGNKVKYVQTPSPLCINTCKKDWFLRFKRPQDSGRTNYYKDVIYAYDNLIELMDKKISLVNKQIEIIDKEINNLNILFIVSMVIFFVVLTALFIHL